MLEWSILAINRCVKCGGIYKSIQAEQVTYSMINIIVIIRGIIMSIKSEKLLKGWVQQTQDFHPVDHVEPCETKSKR